ncbi:MAG TPA: hypothetical protein VFD92_00510 [Candidatus Binatia bacterium]|nr:hypothetical protein [Candidatus Binatia bacterium]
MEIGFRARAFALRAGAWLAAIILSGGASEAAAQPSPFFDHFDCFKIGVGPNEVQVDPHALDALTLTPYEVPPFDAEQGCRLQPAKSPRPTHLCIPVDKQPRQTPYGTQRGGNFLVYRMRCPAQADFRIGVVDQFVRAVAGVKRKSTTRFLLVPAYDIENPDTPCGPTGAGQCGGGCPNVSQSCVSQLNGVCACVEDVRCGGTPVAGQCNGSCAPGEICGPDQLGGCACLR